MRGTIAAGRRSRGVAATLVLVLAALSAAPAALAQVRAIVSGGFGVACPEVLPEF